jgi:hypothetical protein
MIIRLAWHGHGSRFFLPRHFAFGIGFGGLIVAPGVPLA